MKKRYIAIALALLCKCAIWAQEVKVKSFELDPTDLTAQHENVKDANGDICALIKVQILDGKVKFEGDIIGQPKHSQNEYYVYVINGTQRLKISTEDAMPAEIEFEKYGVEEVKGGSTYVLKMQMPEKAPGATFEVGMPGVNIVVDGKSYKTDAAGGLDLPLNKGRHAFVVSMKGYKSLSDTLEIDKLPVIKNIVLQRGDGMVDKGLLTITYPLDAEFSITPVNDEAAQPVKKKVMTGEQIALNGMYQVSFEKKKYKPQIMTVFVEPGKEVKRAFVNVALDADDRLMSNDFSKAFKEYKKLADKGDDLAQYKVGCCYDEGKGTVPNSSLAIGYWTKAAARGNMDACRKLVMAASNEANKKEWLLKLADNGDVDAIMQLANSSMGNAKMQWLQKASDLGSPLAYFDLGQMYYEGEGVQQNYTRAYRYFEKSNGYSKANERILDYTYFGLDNQEADKKKAVEGYEKIGEKLSDDGIYKVGMYYYDVVHDMDKADSWFSRIRDVQLNDVHLTDKAREVFLEMAVNFEQKQEMSKSLFYYQLCSCDKIGLKEANVYNKLGNAFRLGRYVNADYGKAFAYYQKASNMGNKDGYCWLGYCYEKGYGISKDLTMAVQLYQKADMLGSEIASGYLATMYAKGEGGLPKNMDKAEYLWKKAANANQISAVRNLVKLYKSKKNQNEFQKWSKKLEQLEKQ